MDTGRDAKQLIIFQIVFNMRVQLFFFIALFILSGAGCYYDKEELLYAGTATVDCTTVVAKFGTDINPIIQSKCATVGCHSAAAAAGGSVLVTYAQIAGQASRIMQRAVVDKTMPTSGPLLPAEIAKLKCWISSGALNK